MAIFLCRWPNGSFSVIGAANKADALLELDEIGDTDGAEMSRMPCCLLDFDISPEAASQHVSFDSPFRFAGFGEQTRDFILEKAYPNLAHALPAALEAPDPEQGCALWSSALEQETQRVKHQSIEADSEVGRLIQNQMGMSGEVANRVARHSAEQILKSFDGDSEPKQ